MVDDFVNSVHWRVNDAPVDYLEAVQEMGDYAQLVIEGKRPELVWFLEHPPIYTVGTSGNQTDVLQARCPVIQTGRGGQVTYHGPGQRIVYLVLDLNKRGRDLRAYVRLLEEWIIKTLETFQVKGTRREGRVGIWVPRDTQTDDKIAAIGVRVKKWVTLHGIAINVNPDLSYYNGIVPCGIRGHGVTSLEALGLDIPMPEVDQALRETFAEIFSE